MNGQVFNKYSVCYVRIYFKPTPFENVSENIDFFLTNRPEDICSVSVT